MTRCCHCLDPVPLGLIDPEADDDRQFCCHGCEIAYTIINEHHAEGFYQLRERLDISPLSKKIRPQNRAFDYSDYDSEAFAERYIRSPRPDVHAITWFVEGAHCAACVWLLERLHLFDPAILSSRLHIGMQQLHTYHNPAHTSPAQIARVLASLGYRLLPWHSPQRQQQHIAEQRRLYIRFAIAATSMLACMHISWNLLAGEMTNDFDTQSHRSFALLAAALSMPAILYGALPWYRSAWNALRRKRFNLDASVSSILLAGTTISLWHLAIGRSDIYFDSMAMFVCFLLGGRLVLYLARQQVGQQQDALKQLLPLFIQQKDDDGQLHTIAIDDIAPKDCIVVQAGQRAPVDGMVLDDHTLVDNALLSGEQMPIEIMRDGIIAAGARILERPCHILARSYFHNSRLAGILAHDSRSDTCAAESCDDQTQTGTQTETVSNRDSDLSERILQWFTPIVIFLGLATWLYWAQFDSASAWNQAIAVFIVACPCALGIASPLAQSMLIHSAARAGVLISNVRSLHRLPRIRHIVFDKTGTLSTNTLVLQHMTPLNTETHADTKTGADSVFTALLPHLVAACRQSQHPVAHALIAHYSDYADSNTSDNCTDTSVTFIRQGFTYACPLGVLRLQKSNDGSINGCNHSDLLLDDLAIAQFVFSDELRHELMPFLTQLRHQGYHLSICSGDLHANAVRSGSALGFDRSDCHGDCSPEDKQAYIRTLQATGSVLMVGDGINDALALDQADVSIGVRGGLEAAMQHSDIYISGNIEHCLPHLWTQARQHRQCLNSCLIISLIYNVIGIGAAMLGYWGPFICAVAMPISSLSIIIIAWNWPHKTTPSTITDIQPSDVNPC